MENNQKPILIKDLGTQYTTKNSKNRIRYGLYKCFCGNEFKAPTAKIKIGHTKSCGCLYKKQNGLCNHRMYSVWSNMKARCYNKNHKYYSYYGGKGIIICDRWMNLKNFIEDMYPTYKDGLSIDRIDGEMNYQPSNCRWTTKTVQSRNTKRIRKNNTSGYRGVNINRNNSRWTASIRIQGKANRIGTFDTKIEAAKAYDKYVKDNNLEHTTNFS